MPLATDDSSERIQGALKLIKSHHVTVGAASAKIADPFDDTNKTKVIRVESTTDCWIEFGDSTVVAAVVAAGADGDSTFLQAGVPDYFTKDAHTHVAVIQDAAGGKLFVTELG